MSEKQVLQVLGLVAVVALRAVADILEQNSSEIN